MRKICLKVHRWLGLAFGGIISIICLTGAVIVFQDEIKEAINADIRHVEDKGEGRYLTDEALIDAIRRHTVEGLTLKSIQMASNADEPAYAQFAERGHQKLADLTAPYKVAILLCLVFLVQVWATRHFQSLPPK